ncbi:hypothetical protein IKB17_06175 [bacterium]|nr:hypothetical protein [bacterium]
MKKFLLLSSFILLASTLSVSALVTIEENTDVEYLINSGHSEAVASDIFMLKNRANGRPIEPLYERSTNCFVKVLRKLYAYVDSAQDMPDRIHHDIKSAPHYSDL